MIKILHITIAGHTLLIGRNKPRCLDRKELEAYRQELWAAHCRASKKAYTDEDAHNKVLFTYTEN